MSLLTNSAGFARIPTAPAAQRPVSLRVAPPSSRPLSARPNLHPQSLARQFANDADARPNSARKPTFAGLPASARRERANVLHAAECSNGMVAGGIAGEGNTEPSSDRRKECSDDSAIHEDWTVCCGSVGFLRIVQKLCSLGKSSKTDTAISRTRVLVREGLQCEGCSVFLVVDENRVFCNTLSAPELPSSLGVVGRVVQRLEDMIIVDRVDTCDFFDQRVDRDPDLNTRMGKGLLAHGVFSESGELMAVILAVGKLQGYSFDQTDAMIMKAIAAQVGMILGLCKTVRKMENTFKEGERDIRFAKALNECRASDSVLTLAQQYFREITGATKVRFFDAQVFAVPQVADGLLNPHNEQPVETAQRAFKSGKIFLVEDMTVNEQYSRMRNEHDLCKSVLSCPMRVGKGGKILGVLQGIHGDAFKFSRHQAELMEPMLFMMTKVLERTQMTDNTLKLQTKLPQVFTTRDVRDTIFVAEGLAREVLSAQSVCVFVLNQANKKIWTVHPTSSERDEFSAGIGLVGDCLDRDELIQVPNALKDVRYFDPIDGTKCMDLGTQYRHMMLAPIRALQDKRMLGVLVISRDQNQSFSPTDENLAQVIAITLSAAFEVCMENEIYEVALKDNRSIMRLAAKMHHKSHFPELAHVTILGTMEAMQASDCIVLLKWEANGRVQKCMEETDISKMKLRKFSLLDGRLEEDIVQWDDAVIEQSILKGMMVNITSQRMLNAINYKCLHRFLSLALLLPPHIPFPCLRICICIHFPLNFLRMDNK